MRFSDVEEQACRPLGGPSFGQAHHVGIVYTSDNGFDPILADFGFVGYPPTEYQVWAVDPPAQPRLTWTVPDVDRGYIAILLDLLVGNGTPIGSPVGSSGALWIGNTNNAAQAILAGRIVGAQFIAPSGNAVLTMPKGAYLWSSASTSTAPTGAGTAISGGSIVTGVITLSLLGGPPETYKFHFTVWSVNSITGFRLYRSSAQFVSAPGIAEGDLIADETVLSRSTTTAGFTVPAAGSNVTLTVDSTAWITANTAVLKNFVVPAVGAFELVSASGTSLTLKYLAAVPSTFTRYNTHSGDTVNSGAVVVPCSYNDTLGPSPNLYYRLVGLSSQFSFPTNDVSVGVQGAFQDLGIDWTASGNDLGAVLQVISLNGLPGATSLVFRETTMVLPPDIEGAANLGSASFPNLASSGNYDFRISGCPLFTTFSIPVFMPANGQNLYFDSNALTTASVNGVLARAVANPAYVSGNVILNGGTNAAPSAQGATDKATLIARGVNVLTN